MINKMMAVALVTSPAHPNTFSFLFIALMLNTSKKTPANPEIIRVVFEKLIYEIFISQKPIQTINEASNLSLILSPIFYVNHLYI